MASKRFGAFIIFALLALALAVFASSGTGAGDYRPQSSFSVAVPAAGVASNTTLTVTIPAPDYNYEDSSMYSFIPIDWQLAPGDLFPIGAWMGQLSSSTTLGLLNSACIYSISPYFNLYNASVDTSQQLTPAEMAWTNTATLPPDANADDIPDYLQKYPHFLNLMLDPDGAGVRPPLVPHARYAGHKLVATSWMLIQIVILDPGQLAQLPAIKAQMGPELGWGILTVLNNPIDQIENPGAVSDFCTSLQSITTLYGTDAAGSNPPDEILNPSHYGAYGWFTGGATGNPSQTNPPDNSGILGKDTHLNRTYSQSERDFDGDGFENDFDPCFYTPDPTWNPRTTGSLSVGNCVVGAAGDQDCDGLPNTCDPFPAVYDDVGLVEDEDDDGYNNRQDICPLVADGPGPGNQLDTDGLIENADLGPKPDSIGDACDDSDNDGKEDGSTVAPGTAGSGNCRDGISNDADGLVDMLDPQCLVWTDKGEIAAGGRTQLEIYGTNPGTGLYFHAMPWAAVCIGDTDTDGDGYCNDLETQLGSNTAVAGSKPESLVIDASLSGVGANVKPSARVPQSCSDGVDNDADTKIDGADNSALGCDPTKYAGDGDRDGVPDASDNCGLLCQVPNPEQHDADLDGKGDACDADSFVDMTTNSDADSFVDSCDNCPTTTSEDQTDTDADGWGDACDGDSDDDGFADQIEWYLGTDPADNCPDNGSDDAWPLDMDNSTSITVVADVFRYVGNIGRTISEYPSLRRLDLNGDGVITAVNDVTRFYRGMIGAFCGVVTPHPPSWSQGAPVTMDIDPDITGNSANTLGTVESCVRVDVPSPAFDGVSDYNIDIVVTGDTQAPVAYDASLNYDNTKVHIAAPGTNPKIKMPTIGSWPIDLSEARPDLVSPWHAAAVYLLPPDAGTAGNGTLVRVGLDIGGSGLETFSLNAAPLTAYASDGLIHPVVLGSGKVAINTPCPALEVDLSVASAITAAPATLAVSVNGTLSVSTTGTHTNLPLPDTVNATVRHTVTAPAGCTVNAGPSATDSWTGDLAGGANHVLSTDFTIHCSEASDHQFTVVNTITLNTADYTDPTPANNTDTKNPSVEITTVSDIKITSFSVVYTRKIDNNADTVPDLAVANVSTPTNVILRKVVHNNGPYGPTEVKLAKTGMVMPYPPPYTQDATVTAYDEEQAILPVSIATTVDETFVITCNDGAVGKVAVFAFTNNVTVKDAHITDPSPPTANATLPVLCVARFAPGFVATIDEDTCDMSSPVDDICLLGLPCKSLTTIAIPADVPKQPLSLIQIIVLPAALQITQSTSTTTGSVVGQSSFSVIAHLQDIVPGCALTIGSIAIQYDACMPGECPNDPTPANPGGLPPLDLFPGAPAPQTPWGAGMAFVYWAPQLDAINNTVAALYPGSTLWAHYAATTGQPLNTPINILVWKLADGRWLTIGQTLSFRANNPDNDLDGLWDDVNDADDDGDTILDGKPRDNAPNPCIALGNPVGCADNCPLNANADQADADGDGVGNACDHNPAPNHNLDMPTYTCSPYQSDTLSLGEGESSVGTCNGEVLRTCEVAGVFPVTAILIREDTSEATILNDTITCIDVEDEDNDGVPNSTDLCPGTAPGAPVDANGCSNPQVDPDEDGICSPGAPSGGPAGCTGIDLCPGTAPGDPVDADGCSNAQVDPDEDGICSPGAPSGGPAGCTGADNCPFEAEDYDGYDTDACPDPDNDGDTIVDACIDQDLDGLCDPGPISGTENAPITASQLYMSRPNGMPAPLWPAILDNCRDTPNPTQADADGDRIGDLCDSINNPDNDDDGIVNAIDGVVVGGHFHDQSAFVSENFTDAHLPLGGSTYGRTFGRILDRADLSLAISDLVPNTQPAQEGVRIEASGGTGTAQVSTCGFATLSLTAGNAVDVRCGSVTIEVVSGPVSAEFGSIEVFLSTGALATVEETSPNVFLVSNSPSSSGSVLVEDQPIPSGGSLEVCSGDNDCDGDDVLDGADNCRTAANPGQTNTDVTTDPPGDPLGDACDSCPSVANPDQTNTDANLEAVGASVAGDSLGDACDDNDDNDGFGDDVEIYLNTVGLDNCPGSPPGSGGDAWPLDNNMDGDVSVTGDVFNYVGRIGAAPGSPNWWQRLDLDMSGDISVTGDVFMYVGKIGATCT